VALALLAFTGEDTPLIPLDDDTRAAIREGTAQAGRGEFVPVQIRDLVASKFLSYSSKSVSSQFIPLANIRYPCYKESAP
jgi:hypothetical protein